MLNDAYGLPVSTDSPAVVAAIDTFVEHFLGYGQQADAVLKAVEHDPECALAQACCAALYMFLEAPQAPQLARPYLAAAQRLKTTATAREQLFIDAIAGWVENDMATALRRHEQLAAQYPWDLAAIKIGQYHYFNLGDAAGMLRLALQARAGGAASPYLDGMLAFGFEQCHRLDLAEQSARAALAQKPDEPWAHHALAHVFETQGRIAEGIEFLESHAASWATLNSFMHTHNWWHLCLLYIDRERFEQVQAIYPQHIWGVWKEYSQDQIGAVSLLARLELAGVNLEPALWQELGDYLSVRINDVVQPFLSLQYLYGLARAERPEAETLLANIAAYARQAPTPSHAAWADVTLPASYALLAHASGQYAAAARGLEPVLTRLQTIGGSHAQRDLFWQIYLDALLGCGRLSDAQQILQLRYQSRPDSPLLKRQLQRVYRELGLSDF